MTKPVKIKADIFWANLTTENEMSGRYQVDLGNLSPKAVEALNDLGLDVKYKEDKGDFITCKSTRPMFAFDTEGKDISDVGIGNGSKAIGVIDTYEWSFKNKKGVSPSLKKLVITDLVALDGEVDDDLDDIL